MSSDVTATISTLTAIDQVTGKTLWTYQGGYIATPPIVIDGILVVANQAGNVYAMDVTSDALVWSGNTGTPLLGTDEQNADQLTGLGSGRRLAGGAGRQHRRCLEGRAIG